MPKVKQEARKVHKLSTKLNDAMCFNGFSFSGYINADYIIKEYLELKTKQLIHSTNGEDNSA